MILWNLLFGFLFGWFIADIFGDKLRARGIGKSLEPVFFRFFDWIFRISNGSRTK